MWAILFVTSVLAENLCEDRCSRIYQRSLARVGFDDEKLRNLLEKQRPLGTVKDVCWRVYDHLDCMKHCGDSPEHEKFAKYVRVKCRFALRGIDNALSCVSRYHSFMEVRCSTFLKEAERLKSLADPSYTPGQEICRYLHLNTLCLENTVSMYCANAKKVFRRLNFRDYFPNFILPSNDTLFDDLDLDACQMFDFVRKNIKMPEKQLEEELTTVINNLERDAEAKQKPPPTVITSTDRTEFTTLLKELLDESVSSETTLPAPNSGTKKIKTTCTRTRTTPTLRSTSTTPVTTTTTTTTTATATSTTTATTTGIDDESEHEEYEEYEEEKRKNVTIDVVPIRNMLTPSTRTNVTESPHLTTKRRLFSDDSWEQPPPNFGYSSMRFANGGVTPLNIDTSTLFDMDDENDEDEEGEEERNDEEKKPPAAMGRKKETPRRVEVEKTPKSLSATDQKRGTHQTQRNASAVTQQPETSMTENTGQTDAHTMETVTPVTPLLRGDVIVKRIHEWDDEGTNSQEFGANLMRDKADEELTDNTISMEIMDHTESSLEIGNTTMLPRSNIDCAVGERFRHDSTIDQRFESALMLTKPFIPPRSINWSARLVREDKNTDLTLNGSSDSDEFDSDSEESEERDVAPEGRPNVYSTIPPLHAAKFMNTSVMRRRR
ncbi:hypothetical protein RB195_007762 [Necator americanus]|uniref:Chondroitin proteoglycan 4 domain-containing protein n=1 Tax=Necator americanus TaxID=51031 RepID=A0ABR1C279_NECAM